MTVFGERDSSWGRGCAHGLPARVRCSECDLPIGAARRRGKRRPGPIQVEGMARQILGADARTVRALAGTDDAARICPGCGEVAGELIGVSGSYAKPGARRFLSVVPVDRPLCARCHAARGLPARVRLEFDQSQGQEGAGQ